MVKEIFNYVTDQARTETFGGQPLWGSDVPRSDSFNRFGHVAIKSCITAVPGSTRHRDSHVVEFSQAADINVQDAIKVVSSLRGGPP